MRSSHRQRCHPLPGRRFARQICREGRPIERGRPGPGLLAHVLVNKYADHLPLYRQSGIFDRDGIDIDRSTLADWVGKPTALLEPLADAIGRHWTPLAAMFWQVRRSLQMTRPSRCLPPAPARPRPRDCGLTVGTRDHGVAAFHPPAGISSRQIAKGSTQRTISQSIQDGCMPMAMLGSKTCIVPATSAKSPAWPPPGRLLCNRLRGDACQA